MLNIVFLGNFRVDYTSETHHANTLESMGHDVIRLQESEVPAERVLEMASEADLFVWVHTHGWPTPGTMDMEHVLKELKKQKIPTVTYHLDLWFGLERQKDLDKDPVYKHIQYFYTVDSKMAEWFNENTKVKGRYLPAGVYDKEAYIDGHRPKYDVVFVGSKNYHDEWPYRRELIEWLSNTYRGRFKHFGNGGLRSVRGRTLNQVYSASKVVVGDTLCPGFNYPDYWSDRIYETLGRGGFLIHPYIPGIEKEFEDKKHVVFYEYGNFEQLKELIDYYLKNPEEREEIRLAGHEHVKNNYTYKHRWQYILKDLGL